MSSTTALSVTGGEMKLNNVNGFGFNPAILASCFGDDFTIDGTVFADNGSIIAGNGTGHVSLAGFNGSATLKDLTMSGTAFVPIQLRGKTPSAPLGTVAFQNVAVSGSTPRPAVYIQVYTSLANLSFTGLNLSGMSSSNAPGGFFSNGGMILDHTGPSVPLGNTIFPCQGAGYVGLGMGNTGGATASCATVFGGATTPRAEGDVHFDVNDFAGHRRRHVQRRLCVRSAGGRHGLRRQPVHVQRHGRRRRSFSYQWRRDGNPILGAMSPSYMIAAAALGDAGSYDVVITNACGSEISAAAILTVNPLPVSPSSASSSPPSVCFGVVGNITLSVIGRLWHHARVAHRLVRRAARRDRQRPRHRGSRGRHDLLRAVDDRLRHERLRERLRPRPAAPGSKRRRALHRRATSRRWRSAARRTTRLRCCGRPAARVLREPVFARHELHPEPRRLDRGLGHPDV